MFRKEFPVEIPVGIYVEILEGILGGILEFMEESIQFISTEGTSWRILENS